MENQRTIEDIAYLIKQAKEKKDNKPIVFLGAGASASAGIPLVKDIINDILELHKNKPSIKRLSEEHKKDYYKLMSALSAQERRKLFSDYINNKDVKLNVTHIYLAQMLKEELIDYVLTVNFDDLMLKACALFNFIPPVYDVSILNDFTTTTFLEKSITYLHGQHHGQWLLNAEGELIKVKEAVPKIFERICNKRTWIVIGYSGEDEIVNEIAKIGSFEDDLYWVGYNENPLSEKVKEKLFSNPRTNAYHIKGHDSDSFFLKLHSDLGLHTPEIFNKPFSFLKTMLEQVRDIKVNKYIEHKSLFEGVQERMEISRRQVVEAIEIIENKESEEQLIQRIIEKSIKKDFSVKDAIIFENQIEINKYNKALKILAKYYVDWGIILVESFKKNKDQEDLKTAISNLNKTIELDPTNALAYSNMAAIKYDAILLNKDSYSFTEVFDFFEKSIKLDPKIYNTYYNWGTILCDIGEREKDYKYLEESFIKFKIALELNPNSAHIYYNWAKGLDSLHEIIKDKQILFESVSMYKKAREIDPKNINILNNLGIAIRELAIYGNEEKYFIESINVFTSALDISEDGKLYYNLGITFYKYANTKNDIELYTYSLKNFIKTTNLIPNDYESYNNCGIVQSIIASKKNNIELFETCFKYFSQAIEINPTNSSAFFNWGNAIYLLAEIEQKENLYLESIEKYRQAIMFDHNNDDSYCRLGISLLNLALINGSELVFWDCFSNFDTATFLNPKNIQAFESWSLALMNYSKILNYEDSIKIVLEALEKAEKAYHLGANPYNLSCIYSILGDKENALLYLQETLEKKLIRAEDANEDSDWNNYKSDPDFINLLSTYK